MQKTFKNVRNAKHLYKKYLDAIIWHALYAIMNGVGYVDLPIQTIISVLLIRLDVLAYRISIMIVGENAKFLDSEPYYSYFLSF